MKFDSRDDFPHAEEEIEAVEFTSYHPKRVLDIMPDAKPHPDKVVENSTLASVPAPPIVVPKGALKLRREVWFSVETRLRGRGLPADATPSETRTIDATFSTHRSTTPSTIFI